MTEQSKFFPEERSQGKYGGKTGLKNTPVSVYLSNEIREKIDELYPEMGFENIHQYLQYAASYLYAEYTKNPKTIKKVEKIERPKI